MNSAASIVPSSMCRGSLEIASAVFRKPDNARLSSSPRTSFVFRCFVGNEIVWQTSDSEFRLGLSRWLRVCTFSWRSERSTGEIQCFHVNEQSFRRAEKIVFTMRGHAIVDLVQTDKHPNKNQRYGAQRPYIAQTV